MKKGSKKSIFGENIYKILVFFLELLEIMPNFASTESATLPIDQRTRASLLFYDIKRNIYTKQPLSIDDQIAKLRLQGLVIIKDILRNRHGVS